MDFVGSPMYIILECSAIVKPMLHVWFNITKETTRSIKVLIYIYIYINIIVHIEI
jgi:hypothetical protein